VLDQHVAVGQHEQEARTGDERGGTNVTKYVVDAVARIVVGEFEQPPGLSVDLVLDDPHHQLVERKLLPDLRILVEHGDQRHHSPSATEGSGAGSRTRDR
jgi:hypothetical protein